MDNWFMGFVIVFLIGLLLVLIKLLLDVVPLETFYWIMGGAVGIIILPIAIGKTIQQTRDIEREKKGYEYMKQSNNKKEEGEWY